MHEIQPITHCGDAWWVDVIKAVCHGAILNNCIECSMALSYSSGIGALCLVAETTVGGCE